MGNRGGHITRTPPLSSAVVAIIGLMVAAPVFAPRDLEWSIQRRPFGPMWMRRGRRGPRRADNHRSEEGEKTCPRATTVRITAARRVTRAAGEGGSRSLKPERLMNGVTHARSDMSSRWVVPPNLRTRSRTAQESRERARDLTLPPLGPSVALRARRLR